MRTLLIGVALLAGGLPAQQTWIYNSAGGGHFTNLQVAVDSVAPGDTILLQSNGTYQQLRVRQSLNLVGDVPGVSIYWLEVGQIGYPTFEVSVTNVATTVIDLRNCRISCEAVTSQQLRVDSSAACFVRCTIDGRPLLSGASSVHNASQVAFHDCDLFGSTGGRWQTLSCYTFSPMPALWVRAGCRAQLSDSRLTGAGPAWLCSNYNIGTTALQADAGAEIQLARCALAAIVAAVMGGGLVEHEATTFSSPFTGSPATLPSTTGAGAPPGGTITWGVQGPAGSPAIAVLSFGMPGPVIAPEGVVWIDLSAFAVLRLGFLDTQGQMAGGFAIPLGFQRGFSLTVQGAVQLPAQANLTAALPTVLHVL